MLDRSHGYVYVLWLSVFTGKTEPQLATHVLQFIFISDSGFRFPVAQFPSGECSPSDLYFNFWKGVRKMLEFGFVQAADLSCFLTYMHASTLAS